MFCLGAGSFAFSTGQSWKPKGSELRVGRELSPLTQTVGTVDPRRKVVIGEGDDVRLKSLEIFSLAKDAAKNGNRLNNFRTLGIEEPDKMRIAADSPLYESNTRMVFYAGGTLDIYEKDSEGKIGALLDSFEITDDSRLSWDTDGNHIFSSGSGAFTKGRLTATAGNEILFRTSGVHVEAGRGTMVINLSSAKGEFTGGSGVTYLGFYEGCTIKGASGSTVFGGYFTDTEIDARKEHGTFSGVFENTNIGCGLGSDVFSGYFRSSRIDGGDGTNMFSGMFLQGCEVNGGKDADHFQGRFVDSTVKGNAGDDKFGTPASLDTKSLLKNADGEEYRGLESDFINSELDGGEGDDQFDGVAWASTITMGEGNDITSGVFSQCTVIGGEGDDTLGSVYSLMSSFETGAGSDSVTLGTADTSSVQTDEGNNDISLGHNKDEAVNPHNGFGSYSGLSGTKWQTRDEFFDDPLGRSRAKMFGELDNNRIEAAKGENRIRVHRGPGTQTILAGAVDAQGNYRPDGFQEVEKKADARGAVGASLKKPGHRGTENTSGSDAKNAIGYSDESDSESGEVPPFLGAKDKKVHLTADRYALAFGDTSRVNGAAGAIINAGTGEDIRVDTDDSELIPDSESSVSMRNLVQRYTAYGTYVPKRYRVF